MNLQQTHLLAKLDNVVMAGNHGTIETQYGDVDIYPTSNGYFAEFIDSNNFKLVAFDIVPSVAFLKVSDQIKEINN